MADRIIARCSAGRIASGLLSPAYGFWSTAPCVEVDPSISAYEFVDDFGEVSYDDIGAPWTLDATNGTLTMGAAEDVGLGGVAIIAIDALAENRLNLKVTTTDTAGGAFQIEANSGKKLWFEARLAVDDITDSCFYIGLIDGACVRAGAIDGARNMTNGLYFRTLTADPNEVDWAHTGGSLENIVKAEIAEIVKDRYYRFGFYFDGRYSVIPYIDGRILKNPANVSHARFPNNVCLTPAVFLQSGGTAVNGWLDYIKVVQER